MKYDDATYHADDDVSLEQGAAHIALFLAWAIGRGLVSGYLLQEYENQIELLSQRKITPVTFFLECCDGKLTDQDLSSYGNPFTGDYYEVFLRKDLPAVFGKSGCGLGEWQEFDKLKPTLDRRWAQWNSDNLKSW